MGLVSCRPVSTGGSSFRCERGLHSDLASSCPGVMSPHPAGGQGIPLALQMPRGLSSVHEGGSEFSHGFESTPSGRPAAEGAFSHQSKASLGCGPDGQLVPTGIVGTSRLPWDGWLASSHHSPPLRLWHFLGGQLNVVRDRPASSASSLSLCLR